MRRVRRGPRGGVAGGDDGAVTTRCDVYRVMRPMAKGLAARGGVSDGGTDEVDGDGSATAEIPDFFCIFVLHTGSNGSSTNIIRIITAIRKAARIAQCDVRILVHCVYAYRPAP